VTVGAVGARAALSFACALALAGGGRVTAATVHTVTIDGFAFKPSSVVVKEGDTVVWRNDDPVPHTATAKEAGLDSGDIAAGASYRFVARKKGRFAYLCTLHPIMKGELIVE
jgi:plastocyanin